MKAKVMKVLNDGMWNDKQKYKVDLSDGETYSTFFNLHKFLGQEIEAEVEENQYGKRLKNVKTPSSGSSGGGFKPNSGAKSDPKTMYMAYAKDLTVALIGAKVIDTQSDAQDFMGSTYDYIMKKIGD